MTGQKSTLAISELLAAIEAASSEMNEMGERITALEATNYRLDEENGRLHAELSDMIRRAEAASSTSKAATRGADVAEAKAAEHESRAEHVQTALSAANDDLAKISTAVSDLLARTELRR